MTDLFRALCLALVSLPLAGQTLSAQEPPLQLYSGTYRAGSDGYRVSFQLTGNRVLLTVGTHNCLGQMTGTLMQDQLGNYVIMDDEYDTTQCLIALRPNDQSATRGSFDLDQVPGCTYHHGASCQFSIGNLQLQPSP